MTHQPIGLVLTRTSRAVSRAFDERLAAAGGSLPIWLILLALKTRATRSQSELADAVGIRRRDPASRRTSLVEMTDSGTRLFLRLREAAVAHDTRLRAGLSDEEVARLAVLLDTLATNVT